jgi:Flp pilus assembly protein TadD
LETTLRLLQVQQLLRAGKGRDALAMLAPSGVAPADPILLHAYAALVTSTGDYWQALALWRKLAEIAPSNPESWRMIAAIELWLRRPVWVRWFWPAATMAAALLAVLLVLLIM